MQMLSPSGLSYGSQGGSCSLQACMKCVALIRPGRGSFDQQTVAGGLAKYSAAALGHRPAVKSVLATRHARKPKRSRTRQIDPTVGADDVQELAADPRHDDVDGSGVLCGGVDGCHAVTPRANTTHSLYRAGTGAGG
jgi:hypothetical protein